MVWRLVRNGAPGRRNDKVCTGGQQFWQWRPSLGNHVPDGARTSRSSPCSSSASPLEEKATCPVLQTENHIQESAQG